MELFKNFGESFLTCIGNVVTLIILSFDCFVSEVVLDFARVELTQFLKFEELKYKF